MPIGIESLVQPISAEAPVRLGPMTLEQYNDFLPDGSAHAPLTALSRFFCWVCLVFRRPLDRDPDQTAVRLWDQ